MKNVLITGGAGFIGSHLALVLQAKGYNVTILDNLSAQIHGEYPELESPSYISIKEKVRFIKGSVTSREDWTIALLNQDIVVHLAAETGTGQSMYQIERYTHVNLLGTAIMLDILANAPHQVKKIVVASSRAIYGEGKYLHPQKGIVYPNHRNEADMLAGDFDVKFDDNETLQLLPTDEISRIHPSSVYGITKQNQEQMIMTVCPSIGIAPVAFRYQNVYGPGQSLSNPYTGILSIFSTQILNGNGINVFEDGKESRDFVFISDVVDATVSGIERDEANGEIFNVGSGVATNVLTVASTLCTNYNAAVQIKVTGNFRLGDIRHNFADLSKINALLGFKPKVSFQDGMDKFTKWVLQQNIRKDHLQESLNEMKAKGLYR